MAAKPETAYYTGVHRYLKGSGIYHEKMYNPLRGGTPDVWYSGTLADLWVEYKFVKDLPKAASVDVTKLLSPLQLMWLNTRLLEGRNVAVVVGSPVGGLVFVNGNWNSARPTAASFEAGLSKAQVADYIRRRTMK